MIINIQTKERRETWPGIGETVGGTVNPDRATCEAAGWRDAGDPPAVQDGYQRISDTWSEADGWQVVDRAIAEIEAEQAAARLATLPVQEAAMFKALLRRNFGPDAETNRNITAEYVEGYFAVSQGLTGDQVRDGLFLRELFATLVAWNGTGETWTLFEQYGDMIP